MATDIQKVRFNVKSQYYKAMCSVGTAPCKTLTFSFCLRTVFLMEVVHVGLFWNLWIFCWVFGGWIKLGLPKNKSSCSYVLKTDQNFRTLSWWRRGHQKALAFAFPKMSQYAATCPLQKKNTKKRVSGRGACKRTTFAEDIRTTLTLQQRWNLNFHRPDDIYSLWFKSHFSVHVTCEALKKLWGRVPVCTLKIRDYFQGTFRGAAVVPTAVSAWALQSAKRCHVRSTVWEKNICGGT